jgi:hypothetical protein
VDRRSGWGGWPPTPIPGNAEPAADDRGVPDAAIRRGETGFQTDAGRPTPAASAPEERPTPQERPSATP